MADAKEQPKMEFQQLLDSLIEAEPEEVEFRGKKKKIGWLRRHTQRKFTHIMMKEQDLEKCNVKLCACILSNDVFAWFKPLVYAVRWRWYWYVTDLDDTDVMKVILAAKKKIQLYQSQIITISSTEMKDLMMAMTRREAQAIQAGQAGAQPSR